MTKSELLVVLDELLNKDARSITEADLEAARLLIANELTSEANLQMAEGMRLATYIRKTYKARTLRYPRK